MAEARTGGGMVARLRDRLVIAASARYLAIDLVERHGRGAVKAARAIDDRGGLCRHGSGACWRARCR